MEGVVRRSNLLPGRALAELASLVLKLLSSLLGKLLLLVHELVSGLLVNMVWILTSRAIAEVAHRTHLGSI